MCDLRYPLRNTTKEEIAKTVYNSDLGLDITKARKLVLTFGETVVTEALAAYEDIAGKTIVEKPAGMLITLCRQAHLTFFGPPAPRFATGKRVRKNHNVR